MRFFPKGGRIFLAGILPGDPAQYDIITNKDTKTYQAFLERKTHEKETGWDRLKEMFKVDEFGSISSELNSIYQAGFTGFLFGAIYGGVIQSRAGYMNFMENNQATTFKSHLDAKRKLQDNFTVNFAKGGLKWGWRVGLFTTSYFGIITCVSVYREKSSIYEYLAAGTLTGALYKTSMGLRGMTAGGIIGGALGGVAGVLSLLLLRASGTSMEEVRYWQYKWRVDRDQQVQEAFKHAAEEDQKTPDLLKQHDEKLGDKAGAKISLESVK